MSDLSGAGTGPPAPPIIGGPSPAPEAPPAPPAGPPPAAPEPPPAATQPVAPVIAPPPTPGLSAEDNERALAMYRALNDPTGAGEAMTRLVQRYGQLPDWFTWDHAVDAMRNYAQFLSETDEGGDDGTGQGGGGTVTGGGFDPRMVQQAVTEAVGPLQAKLDEYEQARARDVGDQRAQVVEGAVNSLATTTGLNDVAAQTLLRNVVFGLREAMESGAQVDFRPHAINAYAESVLTHLKAMAQVEQQAQVQNHRSVAPLTRTPTGAPSGPSVPTGMAGAAARAMELARQLGP